MNVRRTAALHRLSFIGCPSLSSSTTLWKRLRGVQNLQGSLIYFRVITEFKTAPFNIDVPCLEITTRLPHWLICISHSSGCHTVGTWVKKSWCPHWSSLHTCYHLWWWRCSLPSATPSLHHPRRWRGDAQFPILARCFSRSFWPGLCSTSGLPKTHAQLISIHSASVP